MLLVRTSPRGSHWLMGLTCTSAHEVPDQQRHAELPPSAVALCGWRHPHAAAAPITSAHEVPDQQREHQVSECEVREGALPRDRDRAGRRRIQLQPQAHCGQSISDRLISDCSQQERI